MRVSARAWVSSFSLVLLFACGGTTGAGNEASGGDGGQSGGTPTGGRATSGGTSSGGARAGGTGSAGEAGGLPALGGAAGAPGSGGYGAAQCDTVGCAPPPLCSTGCPAECGCCPCAEGEAVDIDAVKHECVGGCWAPVDAACTHEGQSYGAGTTYPSGDGCNTCECRADGTVACTLMGCPACDPASEQHRREYVALSPEACATVDYVCADQLLPFSNDCGCGCEQDPSCPEWLDCMPGGADPECSDLDAFAIRCPFSGVAW